MRASRLPAKTGTVEIPPPAEGPALCLPGGQYSPRYTQGQTGFDVGDILLMYTDGLIERRGEDLEDGITRVAQRLQAWSPGAPLGRLCDELIACLGAEPPIDDMCVLADCRPGPHDLGGKAPDGRESEVRAVAEDGVARAGKTHQAGGLGRQPAG